MTANAKTISTARLEVAYEERGNPNAAPVVLVHGFPDDVPCSLLQQSGDDLAEPEAIAAEIMEKLRIATSSYKSAVDVFAGAATRFVIPTGIG